MTLSPRTIGAEISELYAKSRANCALPGGVAHDIADSTGREGRRVVVFAESAHRARLPRYRGTFHVIVSFMVVLVARVYAARHVLSLAARIDRASRRFGFGDRACLLFDSDRPELFRLETRRFRISRHFRADEPLYPCLRHDAYHGRLDSVVSRLSVRRRHQSGHGSALRRHGDRDLEGDAARAGASEHGAARAGKPASCQ